MNPAGDDDLSPADRRVADRIRDLPLDEPAPGWEDRAVERWRASRLGFPDRDTAEAASALVCGHPGAYELEDGSWAAARDSTIAGDGGRRHWASLPDGRFVEVERADGQSAWRVVDGLSGSSR